MSKINSSQTQIRLPDAIKWALDGLAATNLEADPS
jgi:hypothetical protein